ncbi:MAG: hypothetical protein NTV88_02945 [Candidatus Micrarchaeota archaeon]|nr:hypothetical protein [Candidatus Micrarchaeota archaeon]
MKFPYQLFALLALIPIAFSLGVLSPVASVVQQGLEIQVGNVGPGQTFAVVVDPKQSTGGKYGIGGAYDRMSASTLPEGWSSTPSKLYSNQLQTDITVPKDAADGEYNVQLSLWDEAGSEGLGENITFFVKVAVTRDVMDMKVEPPSIDVGAGQPARYTITILNKGIANDIFTVGSSGVRNWEFQRSVYIPSGTSKSLTYEVVGNDEADYQVSLWARSASSDRIYAETPVNLRVYTDLFSDYRAVNRGVLLFPLTEAPVYFLMGLLSNLLP